MAADFQPALFALVSFIVYLNPFRFLSSPNLFGAQALPVLAGQHISATPAPTSITAVRVRRVFQGSSVCLVRRATPGWDRFGPVDGYELGTFDYCP
jgi:hypothetical protein